MYVKAILFLRKDSPICSTKTIEEHTGNGCSQKKTHKHVSTADAWNDLFGLWEWLAPRQTLGFVLFAPPMQNSKNFSSSKTQLREKQRRSTAPIWPYAYLRTFPRTSWSHMLVWTRRDSQEDTTRHKFNQLGGSSQSGSTWMYLYMLLGLWKHLSVGGNIIPEPPFVFIASLFHITKWLVGLRVTS